MAGVSGCCWPWQSHLYLYFCFCCLRSCSPVLKSNPAETSELKNSNKRFFWGVIPSTAYSLVTQKSPAALLHATSPAEWLFPSLLGTSSLTTSYWTSTVSAAYPLVIHMYKSRDRNSKPVLSSQCSQLSSLCVAFFFGPQAVWSIIALLCLGWWWLLLEEQHWVHSEHCVSHIAGQFPGVILVFNQLCCRLIQWHFWRALQVRCILCCLDSASKQFSF